MENNWSTRFERSFEPGNEKKPESTKEKDEDEEREDKKPWELARERREEREAKEKGEKEAAKDKKRWLFFDDDKESEAADTPEDNEEAERQKEIHAIAIEDAKAKLVTFQAEEIITDPSSQKYAEIVADHQFMEAVIEKLEDPTILVREEVEEAAEEFKAAAEEKYQAMIQAEQVAPAPEAIPAEASAADDEIVPTPPASRATPPPPTSPGRTRPASAATGSAGGASPPPGGGASSAFPSSSEATPRYSWEVPKEEKDDVDVNRRVAGGSFLLGYFLGHRRASRRTEARLQPEIEKRDEEIAANRKLITEKETEIRTQAGEIYNRLHPETTAEVPLHPERMAEPVAVIETQPKPIPAAEKPPAPAGEIERTPENKQAIAKAEQLTTPELLQVASTITIEGTSVRRLYETNQIDRGGLLYIVKEVLRGGEAKKAFKSVELGRERQRERAPEFRHDPATTNQSDEPTTSNETVAAVAAAIAERLRAGNVTPMQQARPQADTEKQAEAMKHARKTSRTAVLTISAAVAIGLAALVIWYLFSLR